MNTERSLEIDINVDKNTICFPYNLNLSGKHFSDKIVVEYDFKLDLDDRQICLIKMGMAIFLSQLFLLNKIIVLNGIDRRLINNCKKIIKLLYNIRNYEEKTNIVFPEILGVKTFSEYLKKNNSFFNKKVINLVSGGKDSTVSSILLDRNGYDITNCYIEDINISSSSSELSACKHIFNNLKFIKIKGFKTLLIIACSISSCIGRPPNYNYIPRGRDLLSVLFVLPFAIHLKANYISFSCERDLWINNIKGQFGFIPIHDTQSELLVIEINKIIKLICPEINLFSPIAGIHEIKLLSWLFIKKPDIASKLSSCFYGNWCGECSKCARYYLIQKFVNVNLIKFNKNPLKPTCDYIQKFLNGSVKNELPFRDEVIFLLQNIPDIRCYFDKKQIDILNNYNVNSKKLFKIHSAKLIPRKFRTLL